MLHWTIRNDDFWRNTALQCWNNVGTIRNNVAIMLQRCVALKIVVANRPVQHHLKNNLSLSSLLKGDVTRDDFKRTTGLQC